MRDPDFDYVRELVRGRTAIALGADRAYLAEARLGELAWRQGLGSVDELMDRLRMNPRGDLSRLVVEAMATNETSFFRDQRPFDALRSTILPELIGRRNADRRLRIWCGACASGQEPYSLAILLREHFANLGGWDVSILATDFSAEMVGRARAGRYNRIEVGRGMPARLLEKYFREREQGWEVLPEVRRMVEFRVLNLVDPWPAIPPMDLVLLRNVLIYFEDDDKKVVLQKFARVLRPDGYLILGGAESTRGLDETYERIESGGWGFHRLRMRGGIPGTHLHLGAEWVGSPAT